ncbi:hypothetical protein NC651_016755 [Populus alba x Populus x berolinensis]|nr:hypothetical protein NC651_016755 [Populus alba x Populus x berolinensis]
MCFLICILLVMSICLGPMQEIMMT